MKRFHLILICCFVLLTAACGTAATLDPQPVVETDEPASLLTETYDQSSATTQGFSLRHPTGWLVEVTDNRNLFLISEEGAGRDLFSRGLEPGQLVFQVTLSPRNSPEITLEDHLNDMSRIPTVTFAEAEETVIGGEEVLRAQGVSELRGLTVIVFSRPFPGDNFLDVIAYSRTDEYEENAPLIEAVVESIRYNLATE